MYPVWYCIPTHCKGYCTPCVIACMLGSVGISWVGDTAEITQSVHDDTLEDDFGDSDDDDGDRITCG